jgi:hypothetical protein
MKRQMKRKKSNRSLIFLTALMIVTGFVLFSCNKNSSTGGGTGHLEVRLTDAPANYDAVYIDVQSIQVNVSSDTGTSSGWQTINLLHPGVYNLLDFKNGIDTVLASADLPAGTLSQMRLILGSNNSVVIDGKSYSLKTPSAQQSGLKFNIHTTLTDGIVYRLWIDFDASRSIVSTGNGGHILKPVIRTYAEALGGSIKGFVLPKAAQAQVWAAQGTDTLMALPDSTGYYFIGGVNPGNWSLLLHAQDSSYKDTAFTVSVANGVVTNAGTVTLQEK